MLKEQVFKIFENNYSKISFDEKEIISYKSLLESDIHPSLKNYIKSELKLLYSRDLTQLKKKSIFNFSSVKIDFLINQLFDELLRSTFISLDEINNLLLQAISFNLSHLIKPNWSLKKIIFNDKKNVSSSNFFLLIDYAYFYPYQKNIIIKYFKNLENQLIDSDKFEDILKKIDNKLFNNYKREILLDFFDATLRFLSSSENNSLQIEIILSYLSDKNLLKEYNIIKQYLDKNLVDKLSKSELEKILFDNSTISSQDVINQEDGSKLSNDKQDNLGEAEILDGTKVYNDEKDEINIKNNSNNANNLTLFDDLSDEESLKLDYNSSYEIDSDKKSLETKKNVLDYNSPTEFLKNFSEKEIQRIQENIFNSDSEDFVFMIEKLISSSNYDDSIKILNDIVQLYQIDNNSKELNLLKSALKKFYKC